MKGEVLREQEVYRQIVNSSFKVQQHHVNEIEKYLRFDEKVFDVTFIAKVKPHVIKLYKMSKYLDPKFI